MTILKTAHSLAKSPHAFSSAQINLDKNLSKKIIDWGKSHVLEEDLYTLNNDYGREINPHITILYGIYQAYPTNMERFLKRQTPFYVKLGKISIFDSNLNFDVVKIEVFGDELVEINNRMGKKFQHCHRFPEFKPHVTIAYVQKGKCKNLDGNNEFYEIEINVNCITFSSKVGSKTNIRLFAKEEI